LKKRKPVRAVIDTNLFISGLFADKGATQQLQDLWVAGAFELAASEQILREIENTIRKPYIWDKLQFDDGDEVLLSGLIREKAFIVDTYKTDRIKDDPTDNKFLACALEAKADYVVSGDNHLLSLKHFHGIQIIDARTFVEKIKERQSG
jgi:putative PIN family toxin of toxin-antitoxin system